MSNQHHHRRRPRRRAVIATLLLTLGAAGIATPAFLPRASADLLGTAQPVHRPTGTQPASAAQLVSVPVREESLAQPLVRTPAAPPHPVVERHQAAMSPQPLPRPQPVPRKDSWPPAPRPRETQLPTPEARPAADLTMEREVIALVNEQRRAAGCGPVQQSAKLTSAAYRHSKDMAVNDFFSHTGSDGSSPWDRAKRVGYQKANSENLAAGHETAEQVVEAWMKSPGHRQNVLNCGSKAVGVAVRHGGSYGVYWTQMFGTV
jgi:uncharacterized protein YkwD